MAYHFWLEPGRGDLDEGVRARVADPVWFLARQWQLGELQGEDASSPVRVDVVARHTPLSYDRARPLLDPRVVPAEALLEAEPGDWWTIGRRIRIGRAVEATVRQKFPGQPDSYFDRFRFTGLPAPYTRYEGGFDGAAVFTSGVLAGDPVWRTHDVPSPAPDRWSSRTLSYSARFASGGTGLVARDHDGGDVDWFTVDAAKTRSPVVTTAPAVGPRQVIPNRLSYPGAPHPRWWQIEDHAVDIGGFAPDRSHLGTMLLYDVAIAHSDDWFWFPVPEPRTGATEHPSAGVVVNLESAVVHDSFDEKWTLTAPAATDWSLFQTAGLPETHLVIWPVAVAPQAGPLLDDIALGVDEDANLAWAVELRADGLALQESTATAEAAAQTTRTGTRDFTYLPSTTLPAHWHAYARVRIGDASPEQGAGDGRCGPWRQAIVADLTGPAPRPRPGPQSRLIGGPSGPGAGRGHTIASNALPSSGVRLQRRPMLARDTEGRPVLWIERRAVPLIGPPTSHLRFDVLAEKGQRHG
ncbi:hypothetical protein [Nocardia cyriacigeorgica]|uniref:hypothetical protein n=1 Tax=Nocardia cyriacigeorgica TaxID=135487 RepID=UPI0013D73CF3|nr:hypothetical protein [Nocardia cyriacigeorgica]NEW28857.1 hypothetical protein [Nocardia cyriacigeorgica]